MFIAINTIITFLLFISNSNAQRIVPWIGEIQHDIYENNPFHRVIQRLFSEPDVSYI